MEIITWVGIHHYVEKELLADFYSSLKEGDIVRLVLEPENLWDRRAVSVYHNFIMKGHIAREETDTVHQMATDNKELIGRITDDIEPEINQVKLLVDFIKAPKEIESDYPMLPPHEIGLPISPCVMYEEESFIQIKDFVENWVKMIKTTDINNPSVIVFLREIKQALDIYFTIWDKSISKEANTLPRYFDNTLTELSQLNDKVKAELKDTVSQLRVYTAMQSHAENFTDIFEKQIRYIDQQYSRENGFYETFDKTFAGDMQALTCRQKAIEGWMDKLCNGNPSFRNADFTGFAKMLYYQGYKSKDLYMIITHLLILSRVKSLLKRKHGQKELSGLFDKTVFNNYGTYNDIHDNKIIQQNEGQ